MDNCYRQIISVGMVFGMKIRIVKCSNKDLWYFNQIGRELNVKRKENVFYIVNDDSYWRSVYKEDAEVVEDVKKSCQTCKNSDKQMIYCMGIGCGRSLSMWKPIEPAEEKKDCTTCKFDPNGCNLMGIECDNFNKWKPMEPADKKDVYGFTKKQVEEMEGDITESKMRETADPSKIVRGGEQRKEEVKREADEIYEKITKEEYRTCTNCLYGVDKPTKCGNCHPVNKDQWKPKHYLQEKFDKLVVDLNNDNDVKTCNTCLHRVDKPIELCVPCIQKTKDNWTMQDEIVINASGGKQSKSKYLWLDFCPKALLKVAKLSCAGNEKYGTGNWKKISAEEHINHAINHLMLWLAKDTSEDHLTHACWRVLSALGVDHAE